MRVLLVDDHAIVRSGLRRLLTTIAGAVIFEAASGAEALQVARTERLTLIVLDLNLPDFGGLEMLSRLRPGAGAPILVLSMHTEPLYVSRALESGAAGYVSKNASPEELVTAIHRVAAGGRYVEAELAQALLAQPVQAQTSFDSLSRRDLEILRQLASGRSLAEIAASLNLSYKTVANACTLIKSKLGITRTADLLRLALDAGVR